MTRPDRLSNTELSALVATRIYGLVECQADFHQRGHQHYQAARFECYAPADNPTMGSRLGEYATDSGLALEAALKDGSPIEIVPQMSGGFYVFGYGLPERGVYGSTLARALSLASVIREGIEVEDDS